MKGIFEIVDMVVVLLVCIVVILVADILLPGIVTITMP